MNINTNTNINKLLFKKLINRSDVFAIQHKKGYLSIKRKLVDNDIKNHLKGNITIGIYQLDLKNNVKWGCIDIDRKTEIDNILIDKIIKLFTDFEVWLEDSGNKGFHIWIISTTKKIKAGFMKQIIKSRLNKLKTKLIDNYEIFPKQIKLTNKGLGNLVKLPLGKHKKTNRFSKIINIYKKMR